MSQEDYQNFLENKACIRCRDAQPFDPNSKDCQIETFFSPSLNKDISCFKGLEIDAALSKSKNPTGLQNTQAQVVDPNQPGAAEENARRLAALGITV